MPWTRCFSRPRPWASLSARPRVTAAAPTAIPTAATMSISRPPAPGCSAAAAPICPRPARRRSGTAGAAVVLPAAVILPVSRGPTWQGGCRGHHRHHARRAGCGGGRGPRRPATASAVDGSPAVIGGTSAVAPLWAGLIALINQALGRKAGFVNPTLYANQSAFTDITSGNNGAFSAGPGWDPATGLGSPIGTAVLAALQAAASSPVAPAPTSADLAS